MEEMEEGGVGGRMEEGEEGGRMEEGGVHGWKKWRRVEWVEEMGG